MIDDSHYDVRSNSGFNTYNVVATKFGWACSCPDYARHNAKCKHVYAVEFYRQSAIFDPLNRAVLLLPLNSL